MICSTSTKISNWQKDSESFASATGLPFQIRDVETPADKHFCQMLAEKYDYNLTYKLAKIAMFKKTKRLFFKN